MTNLLYRLLERDERLAVEGDLAESGERGVAAFRQVLGLVARREAARWRNWRPWAAMGMAIPMARWLARKSSYDADHSSLFLWFYANNWISGYVASPGARTDLAHAVAGLLADVAVLAVCSAIAGRLLAWISGRAIRTVGVLFCIALAAGRFVTPAHRYSGNAVVFSLALYASALPWLWQVLVVMAPAILGMQFGRRIAIRKFGAAAMIGAAILPIRAADAPAVRATIEAAANRKVVPQIAVQDSRGKTLTLDRYRGKVVLLDFWGHW